MLLCQTAARRSACLHSLEPLSAFDTTADFIDYFTESSSHRHLNQTDIIYFSCKGEYFRSFGALRSDGCKPVGTFRQNDGDIGKCLYIVNIGRLAQITGFGGERWFEGWFASFSFHRVNQGGFFSADECTCPISYFYIETKISPQDMISQQPILACLIDSDFQTVDSQRIFGTDIHQSFGRTDRITADTHRFYNRMRISLHDGTVHKRTRVSLIGITNHIFDV